MGTIFKIFRKGYMKINKKDLLFYARIHPSLGVYDLCEIIVRFVGEDWFTGIDKRDKRVYLFSNKSIEKTVFFERKRALSKIRAMEKNKTNNNFTIENEDY